MKKTTLLFLLLTCCLLASAQPVAGVATAFGATTQVVRDGERERINTERARLETGFTAEDIACYKKFLTNKCLAEVKVRRDAVMADFRRQEISLDQQERKEKGAEQIRKTEEKFSAEKQQEAADKRATALKENEARLEREKQKFADRASMQSNEKSNTDAAAKRLKDSQQKFADRASMQSNEKSNTDAAAKRLKDSQQKADRRKSKQAASAEEVRKFNERLKKAKERQSRYERDLANQTKPPANPLPKP